MTYIGYKFLLIQYFAGDLWQLPPIFDNLVTENNSLDGRPACAPSHWDENFRIYYLTEKMRSLKDPYFSDLCDRVGRGKLTEEDKKYLQSRVIPCELENDNESFKSGKLLIIVTTNLKKDLINEQKLNALLPDQREFLCNSIDRVTNLPSDKSVPEKLNTNPGRTGNLQNQLKLRIGAPVVITSNNSKQKYREDGLVNGARGFVQAIQCSKDNPNLVEVIWIVFHDETVGRLYRFEFNHLRKIFNPGHKYATPIFPARNTFKAHFGNIEYQRQNFPLSLAYAVTAWKAQGDTLSDVIVDFGPDEDLKIKNYIVEGGFYVAISRVREKTRLYLKSFDESYIKVNTSIQQKIDAMLELRKYQFKKHFLDHDIFVHKNQEFKTGYLNINGLTDGNHIEYFNLDRNLLKLDLIVLAETKLKKGGRYLIEEKLSNWKIIGQYDSDDSRKHMGLLLLKSKTSTLNGQILVTYKTAKRNEDIQIEGLIVKLENELSIGYIYCRSTPTVKEIEAIQKCFAECNYLLGDLNLSHRVKSDQAKLTTLCGTSKVNILDEITRSVSNNQLDYIVADKNLVEKSYATSFHNFISDHKSITLRVGLHQNEFSEEFKMRISFDQESHLKSKKVESPVTCSDSTKSTDDGDASMSSLVKSSSSDTSVLEGIVPMGIDRSQVFSRRFRNVDLSTCWLNSVLQLILNAFDYSALPPGSFTSELGQEVLKLINSDQANALDPSQVKNVLISTEDTRIALRISEVEENIEDSDILKQSVDNIKSLRFNMLSGQQCIRDLFMCLGENQSSWPDIASNFVIRTHFSSVCCSCNGTVQWEKEQLYLEIQVPPDGADLNSSLEDYFNTSDLVGRQCDDACKKFVLAESRNQLTLASQTKFILVILSRGLNSIEGFNLNQNETNATNDLFIR